MLVGLSLSLPQVHDITSGLGADMFLAEVSAAIFVLGVMEEGGFTWTWNQQADMHADLLMPGWDLQVWTEEIDG